jgi:hypothetical protein
MDCLTQLFFSASSFYGSLVLFSDSFSVLIFLGAMSTRPLYVFSSFFHDNKDLQKKFLHNTYILSYIGGTMKLI